MAHPRTHAARREVARHAGSLAHLGKARRQEFAIVKIKDVREKEYLQEICKYVVEGSELAKWPAELINEFVQAQRGLRMFNSFGTLREMAPQIRREIAALKPPSPTCECGADDFVYQSEESVIIEDAERLDRNSGRYKRKVIHEVREHGVVVSTADTPAML